MVVPPDQGEESSSTGDSFESFTVAEERERFADLCRELRNNSPEATRVDLQTYDFSLTDDDAALLGSSLENNTHVQKLFLILNHFSGSFRGLLATAHFVRRSRSLLSLELVDAERRTSHARAHITDVFLLAAAQCPNLSKLTIFGVSYGASSFAALVRSSETVTSIHYYRSQCVDDLSDEAVLRQLTTAFSSNTTLQAFLTGNMESQLTVPLLRQLQFHPTLTTVGPSPSDHASADALAELMRSPPPCLKHVELMFVEFSWAIVEPLLPCFQMSRWLERLHIRDCDWPLAQRPLNVDVSSVLSTERREQPANRGLSQLQQRFFTSVLSNVNIEELEITHNTGLDPNDILAYHSLRGKCLPLLAEENRNVARHGGRPNRRNDLWARLLARCLRAAEDQPVGISAAYFCFRTNPSLLDGHLGDQLTVDPTHDTSARTDTP